MRTAAALVFSIAYLVIAAREHLARGGPQLAKTIASNSSNSPRDAEASLLLYEWASKNIPRGATVAAFKPKQRGDDPMLDRVSHGQLPHHRVVPVKTLESDNPPDYVITLGAPLHGPRYAHFYETRIGAVWKRMH